MQIVIYLFKFQSSAHTSGRWLDGRCTSSIHSYQRSCGLNLQHQLKWQTISECLQADDILNPQNGSSPGNEWKLIQVEEVQPNGKVQRVKLLVSDNIWWRKSTLQTSSPVEACSQGSSFKHLTLWGSFWVISSNLLARFWQTSISHPLIITWEDLLFTCLLLEYYS